MNKFLIALTTAGLGCAIAACGGSYTSPATKAASVEQIQCRRGALPGEDVRVLQTTTVLSAMPLYSHVITGKNDSEDRVTGARLMVRPPEGVSAERMTRILQCHSAQVLLGQVDTSRLADDPYYLPNAWLDIDVKPESGNFEVVLRAQSIPDGLAVFHKATAFAESHRTTAEP
jgi:hypothetical protein